VYTHKKHTIILEAVITDLCTNIKTYHNPLAVITDLCTNIKTYHNPCSYYNRLVYKPKKHTIIIDAVITDLGTNIKT